MKGACHAPLRTRFTNSSVGAGRRPGVRPGLLRFTLQFRIKLRSLRAEIGDPASDDVFVLHGSKEPAAARRAAQGWLRFTLQFRITSTPMRGINFEPELPRFAGRQTFVMISNRFERREHPR